MTVTDYQKYQLSKRATSRIKSRFSISNSQTVWALNVLKKSKMKSKDGNNTYTVATGNIDTVINTENHLIITIYPCSDNELDKEFTNIRGLNLRSYFELKEYAHSRYRVELRNKAKRLQARHNYISELYNQLSKTQSRKLMQEVLIKINQTKQDIEVINTQLLHYRDFVEKF